MKLISLAGAAAAILLAAGHAVAADPGATAVAELLKPFLILPADSGGAWEWLERDRAVRWGAGPTMLSKPSPDGNFFARPGQATLSGRPVTVVASGARSMVFSVYIRDPAPPMAPEALATGLREAGFTVTPARCPIDPRAGALRRWYRLALARKKPAFLYTGPLQSGGAGYTLYLGDLPLMTPSEAALYTDNCAAGVRPAGGGISPAIAARPGTAQAGVVAVIEALLRPAGAPANLPWSSLASLPMVTWPGATPMKMSNPYSDVGQDLNPRLLGGEFKTPTTKMQMVATGDERAANRFMLRDGQRLPRGAVFEALRRDGYVMTPLRCGKVYTETSQAWFRISGPGKQPAILYRAHHISDSVLSEDYALRLDNLLPPGEPGQTPPVAGRCRDQ